MRIQNARRQREWRLRARAFRRRHAEDRLAHAMVRRRHGDIDGRPQAYSSGCAVIGAALSGAAIPLPVSSTTVPARFTLKLS